MITRHEFILRGALATAAVYGTASVSPFVGSSLAQGQSGDVDILNFALTLEVLEATFYEQALKRVSGLKGETLEVTRQIADDEREHVKALTETIKQLGGTPAKPTLDFDDEAFASPASFLDLAERFEETGVSAYNGAGPLIKDKKLLATAGAIVQVEARHAARIRMLNGQQPAPIPFDKPLSKVVVFSNLKRYLPTAGDNQ